MNKVTDGGLVALAGAVVGPGLEHLEFRSELACFQFKSWWFSVVVVSSSPSNTALIVLLISGLSFGEYVGGLLSGGCSPRRCVFLCLCASVLILRLVECDRVWCMRVTELGILCAFWM